MNLDLPRTHCPLVFLFVVFGIGKICCTLATIRSCFRIVVVVVTVAAVVAHDSLRIGC